MRITTTMITMAALMGLDARAAEPGGTSATTVSVCLGLGVMSGAPIARVVASKMFAGIGVTIDWRTTMALFRSRTAQFPLVLELKEQPDFSNPLESAQQVFDRLEQQEAIP